MSLKGTLRDFSIPDIFQLIGQQHKNGELFISSGKHIVKIWFHAGNIVFIEKSPPQTAEWFVDHLTKAQLLPQSLRDKLLQLHYDSHIDIVQLIKQNKFIDPSLLERFLNTENLEILYRVFLLKDGFYEFEPKEVTHTWFGLTPISCEHVVMEGARRIDEWPQVQRKIKSSLTRFKKTCSIPEMEADPNKIDDEIERAFVLFEQQNLAKQNSNASLAPNERLVLKNVTRERTVRDLVAVCLIGEFETCKALVSLMDRHFITPIRPSIIDEEGYHATRVEETTTTTGALVSALLALFLVTLALFITAALGHRYADNPIPVLSSPFSLKGGGPLLLKARTLAVRNQYESTDTTDPAGSENLPIRPLLNDLYLLSDKANNGN